MKVKIIEEVIQSMIGHFDDETIKEIVCALANKFAASDPDNFSAEQFTINCGLKLDVLPKVESNGKTKVQLSKQNFKTLSSAFDSNDVALLECYNKKINQKTAVICAVQSDSEGLTEFIPFAEMLEGNPYEYIVPPTELVKMGE